MRMKLPGVMVAGSIGRLKMAVICLPVTTPVELSPGSVEVTAGAEPAPPEVLNVQT